MRGYTGDFVRVYLDYVLILSENWTEHLKHLRCAFQRLREAGLKLKPTKCRLAVNEVEFLGHKLTHDGLRMNEGKITAVKNFPVPRNVKQLQRFLGLTGYYRKFAQNFSIIAKPLYTLLKKNVKFIWSQECQEAFSTLIEKLCNDVVLQFPDFYAAKNDPTRRFVIQTDASKTGIAGILGQPDNQGKIRPIYFVSRACTKTECRYSATELEALALRYAVKKFSSYIIGLRTLVETDHSALE